jgi:chromosomal replication initiation ATPase DnaA
MAPVAVKVPVYTSFKMDDIKRTVTQKHGVSIEDIFSRSRVKQLVAARREFIQRLHHEMRWNADRIAAHLQIDRSTVNHHLGLRRTSSVKYGAIND